MRILLCGPVAPPVGGVSVHLSRLSARLRDAGHLVTYCDEARLRKPGVFNIRGFNLLGYFHLVAAADVVHIHSGITIARVMHASVAFIMRRPTVVTLHSFRGSRLGAKINSFILRLVCAHVICVSEEIRAKLGMGVVLPAYLPAREKDEQALPENVRSWIESKKLEGKKIAVSNAGRMSFYSGVDLYGLDLVCEAASLLKSRTKIAFVFIVGDDSGHEAYVESVEQKAAEAGLGDFLIMRESLSYPQLLLLADVSVRATVTDGDALSVRESIAVGCPVVASDCVSRPNQVFLFRSRCAAGLASALLEALAGPVRLVRAEETVFDVLLGLYLSCARVDSDGRNVQGGDV